MQPVLRDLQHLLSLCPDAKIIRQVDPAHGAGRVEQEFSGPCDIHPIRSAPDMQQVVRAYDLLLGVGKEGKGKASLFAEPEISLYGVNADRGDSDAALAELAPLTLKAP